MMDNLWQDLRYGIRMLGKSPGFTAVAVLTLALGIGANTAIFSVVNEVLLKPLPFTEPERLVMVWNKGEAAAGGDRTPLAVADLLDWRTQNRACQSVSAFQMTFYNHTGGETPERIRGARVTADFFATLGVWATLGRTFLPDEERPGAPRVVAISHKFWQERLAADPQAPGRALNLSGASYTIVGVMPESFDFPARDVELWTALPLETPTRRGPYFLRGLARLKPGVSLEQARAEMHAMEVSLTGGKFNFNVLPLNEFIVGDVRPALLVLLTAVTFVLLIAVANVANLLLGRAAARGKEMAIRAALGAGRGRIVRQLLTESCLLALLGGALGLLLAVWGVDLLLMLAPKNVLRFEQIRMDTHVLGWAALVSLAGGVIFGLAPALQSSRMSLNEALKEEGGRGAAENIGKSRFRNLLAVSEIALALVLLVGAGLLIKSFRRLQQVDPGIDPERVLTMQLSLPGARYTGFAQVNAFYQQLLERVTALPGVRNAALSNSLPPDALQFADNFTIEGRSISRNEGLPVAHVIPVSTDYFRALSLPLRRGRYFSDADTAGAPRVAIINETMARKFFPNEDPIGKRIMPGVGNNPYLQIVGVVGDVKYTGLEAETQPAFYQPSAQNPSWTMYLIVKTETADPLIPTSAIRNEVKALDRELPVAQVSTLEQRLSAAVAQPRFRTTLLAVFGAVALVLANVGIYGVISYSVTQRTHEIGVRMALGAQAGDVLRLVVGQGMKLALVGVAIGLTASVMLTHTMRGLLFGVSATDPLTFVVISLLLAGVALLACYLPARRAMKVDPMVALRYE